MSTIHDVYFQNAIEHTAIYNPFTFHALLAQPHPVAIEQALRKKIRTVVETIATRKEQPQSYIEKLFHAVHICTDILQKSTFEKVAMDTHEAFLTAVYVHVILGNVSEFTTRHHVHHFPAAMTTTRALQCNLVTRRVAVVAREGYASKESAGTYKKVLSAVNLCLHRPGDRLKPVVFSRFLDTREHNRVLVRQECENLILMQNTDGVVHIESWTEDRTMLVLDGYDDNLQVLLKSGIALTEMQTLTLLRDWTLGLVELHRRQCVHADLNEANMLYELFTSDAARGAIADLGFSFIILDNQEKTFIFKKGFYGHIGYTAPELLGKENYSSNFFQDYLKFDTFALGCALYRFYTKRAVPWAALIETYYREAHTKEEKSSQCAEALKACQATFTALIVEWIEKPLQALEKKPFHLRTMQEKIEFWILSMVRLKPADRISLNTVSDGVSDMLEAHALVRAVANMQIKNTNAVPSH